jgi:type IV pilus modification protein PilV
MATAPRLQRAHSVHRQAGFSLIEALIALLVVSFGMLGIASFQYSLSRASDVAKQRTEATRIAQKEIDRLRSFSQREAETTPTNLLTYVEDLVSAGATAVSGLSTNTTYSMERVVTTPSGDKFRWINVIVSWADRTGQTHDVRLATVISDGDPSDLGILGVTRRTSSTLRPKNRNINVPYPAVNVASCPSTNACSAFVVPPSNVAYVFDNVTGNVIQSCTLTSYPISAVARSGATATATSAGHPFPTGSWVNISGVTPADYNGNFRLTSVTAGASFSYQPANTPAITSVAGASARWALIEGIDLSTLSGVTCVDYASSPRYLLSGYVRFFTGNNPSADDLINPTGTTGQTFDLLSTGPLTIASIGSSAPLGYTCTAQRQKVVATNNVRAETVQTYSRVGNVVTIRTNRNHSFTVGMVVAITGTANYVLQGRFEIASTPSNDTFTYLEVGPNVTDSTGRVELIQQLTLAETDAVPSAYNDNVNNRISMFVAYTCVVEPSATGSPREWWGRLDLVPETSSVGGRVRWDTATYRVCRYSADYNSNGLSNSDHPLNYRRVTGALDNQNFAVIPIGSNCPTDTAPTFTGNQAGDFNNTNTVAHQPTPAYSPTEPNDATTPILMQ